MSSPSTTNPLQLEQAIKYADSPIVQLLLNRGVPLDGALLIAAEFQDDPSVSATLISAGATHPHYHALFRAAAGNKLDIARLLLAHAHLASPPTSSNALTQAALMGNTNMLTLLLDHGFPINVPDEAGRTPLHAAAGADKLHPQVVQLLVDRGVDHSAKVVVPSGDTYSSSCLSFSALLSSSILDAIDKIHREGIYVRGSGFRYLELSLGS